MIRLRARWLFPGDSPPLPHVVVEVEQGRIVFISADQSSTCQNADEIDLGQAALIPGLINAHTHLEFSDLAAPVEPRDRFADWIQAIIQSRREGHRDTLAAIQQGLAESRECGVAGLAEIATSDWILRTPVEDRSLRVFTFREILGLHPGRVDSQLDVAKTFLAQAAACGQTDVGLSPHAPYSLHPRLFRGLIELAITHDVPVAMHLAESPAEMELLHRGTGPLVDLFTRMGIWPPEGHSGNLRPLDFLKELARAPRGLVVHGNFLNEEEMRFVASSPQLSVVYCPRTHQAMQSTPHPWQRLLELGVNVTLGTDSRASNPDLNLWDELRWLQTQAPEPAASSLLKLATANAAQALGWDDLGRLAPGFSAQFGVVPLTEISVQTPEKLLFEPSIPQRLSLELLLR